MARRAKSSSTNNRPFLHLRTPQGFLLIEATLTIVVIAVSLVLISRGVSGSLKALATIQYDDRMLRLAESTLQEVETTAQQVPASLPLSGTLNPPDAAYQWTLTALPTVLVPEELSGTLRSMTLTVNRGTASAPVVRLNTVWPIEWIAQ